MIKKNHDKTEMYNQQILFRKEIYVTWAFIELCAAGNKDCLQARVRSPDDRACTVGRRGLANAPSLKCRFYKFGRCINVRLNVW